MDPEIRAVLKESKSVSARLVEAGDTLTASHAFTFDIRLACAVPLL